jgi:hypothetical protein
VSFVDPEATQNPATDVKATAAYLDTWRDDMEFLNGQKTSAVVLRVTDQTITGTQTFNWTSELFDTGAMHDNSTNNERLTVPTGQAGLYLMGAFVRVTTTTVTLRLRKNATSTLAFKARTVSGPAVNATAIMTMASLAAGDYLTVTGTGAAALDGDLANIRLSFWAHWIGRGVV